MKKFIALLVLVLLVAGLWTGGWFFAAGEIRSTIAAYAANDGEAGPQVVCGTLGVGGFPFRFDVECRDAKVVSGDITATLGGLKASVLVYNPTQAKLSALAPLTVADAFSGASNRIDFSAAEGSARLVTDDLMRGLGGDGWRIGRVSVIADAIEWTDTVLGDHPVLDAGHAELHIVDNPGQHDAAAKTAELDVYAALKSATAPGLDIANGDATFDARLTGVPDDLRDFAADGLVRRWQDAGGQLRVTELKGTAGEQYLESSGILALDSGSRLDGQVQLRSKGLAERLNALLPEDWKFLILGQQAEDGSYSQTVTIKAGVVFTGIMPVMVIPPLI